MKDLVGKNKPFHSAIDMAASSLKRKVGTGAEFLKEIMGLPGIKQAEITERNLGELLGMPKMTHEQFMQALAARPVPAIQEKVLGNDEPNERKIEALARQIAYEFAFDELREDGLSRSTAEEVATDMAAENFREYLDDAQKEIGNDPTYHEKWTLPGGENYREMLIKAPKQPDYRSQIEAAHNEIRRMPYINRAPEQEQRFGHLSKLMRELEEKEKQLPQEFEGVSGHFGGEPGILASMRLKDRLGPNGEKLLHLEELQSDWHQQGRESGYKQPGIEKKMRQAVLQYDELSALRRQLLNQAEKTPDEQMDVFRSLMDKEREVTNQMHELDERMSDMRLASRSGVPNAPFKKNWEEMALKRLAHYAAENGYHGIVVTPGAEQADRYSLAKHIDSLSYEKKGDKYKLRYIPKGERTFQEMGNYLVEPEDLEAHVGKEMAQKIMNKEGQRAGTTGIYTFPNIDLQVGGEGMKGFYDKKVPNILNAIGKKHGVKTGQMNVPIYIPPDDISPAMAARHHGISLDQWLASSQDERDRMMSQTQYAHKGTKAVTKPLHHFPITEEMRKDILTNGLPLYKTGGVVNKAIGGTVQPSTNQMRMALMQNKLAVPASDIQSIGANEAPAMDTKAFVNEGGQNGMGGIDQDAAKPGMQLMQAQPSLDPKQNQPQGGQPTSAGASSPAQQPQGMNGNILQMTPQGRAMSAMNPQQPQGLKKGGQPSVEEMRKQVNAKYKPKAVKASEALGKHEGKHLKVTQADRTKVGEGFLGGPGFSSLQHVDPNYAGAAWGVNTPSAASKIVNANQKHPEGDVLWSTLIGSPTQHTSNQMVFDQLLAKFKAGIKAGKMSPELREAINAKLANVVDSKGNPIFEGNADIAGKNFFKNLNTFDRRRIMADLMGGITVGGKKGQIFDYDKIVRDTTEPELLGAPTHAIGPRLFQLSGLRSYQPELHPAFPHILHGEDLGEMYHPVPREIMLPDFHREVKERTGHNVGFMDLTRNTPSQQLTEKFLTQLQKQGYKKGGKVADNLDTMRLALTKNSKKAK